MPSVTADLVRTVTFSQLNKNKAKDPNRADRCERAVVSSMQLFCVGNLLKNAACGVKPIRKANTVMERINKGVNLFASKLINPILMLGCFEKIKNAEDKKSVLIEEVPAMALMFFAEYNYKKLFGLGKYEAAYKNSEFLNPLGTKLRHVVEKPIEKVSFQLCSGECKNKFLNKLFLPTRTKYSEVGEAYARIHRAYTQCNLQYVAEKLGMPMSQAEKELLSAILYSAASEYKKAFVEKKIKAMSKKFSTKIVNGILGTIKGVGFVATSLATYGLVKYVGRRVANMTTAKTFAQKKEAEKRYYNTLFFVNMYKKKFKFINWVL